MPAGQTGIFYMGVKLTAIFKSDNVNLKDTLNKHRAAIDVFFAGRVDRQKGLRPSAWVCG
jgi:hypothetical protein